MDCEACGLVEVVCDDVRHGHNSACVRQIAWVDIDAIGIVFVYWWDFVGVTCGDECFCTVFDKIMDMGFVDGAFDEGCACLRGKPACVMAEVKDLIARKAHDTSQGMTVINELLCDR